MRTILIPIAALLFIGCAEPNPVVIPTQPAPQPVHPAEPRALLPNWRDYVLSQYQQQVLDRLKSPSTARFLGTPKMLASYSGDMDQTILMAIGEFDAQNGFGALVRGQYMIFWDSPGDREIFSPIHPPLVTITERQ